ncbi:MAG: prephenate dehydrogenase [Acidobacteriota bacterium]|nr:prephenate dehydrogenase [Acidobacteriota bacterium]
MTLPLWDRVTVVGCGLIGASFALALRECDACRVIAGWDSSPSVLDEALARRVIDEVDRSFAAREVSASDLVYLATPVGGIVAFMCECGSSLKPGATVTDAGSTKVEVCRAAREHLREGVLFVGGHPVAGSHRAGIANARADLFRGAPYVLTAGADEGDRRFAMLKETISAVGARVEITSDSAHDRAMAFVSHLPQLLSSALAATVNAQADAESLIRLSGAGYRDMTRLAASPWQMWRDILATNPAPVAEALGATIERLAQLREELEGAAGGGADDLPFARALFGQARRSRTPARADALAPASSGEGYDSDSHREH